MLSLHTLMQYASKGWVLFPVGIITAAVVLIGLVIIILDYNLGAKIFDELL